MNISTAGILRRRLTFPDCFSSLNTSNLLCFLSVYLIRPNNGSLIPFEMFGHFRLSNVVNVKILSVYLFVCGCSPRDFVEGLPRIVPKRRIFATILLRQNLLLASFIDNIRYYCLRVMLFGSNYALILLLWLRGLSFLRRPLAPVIFRTVPIMGPLLRILADSRSLM